MLTAESAATYDVIKTHIQQWLAANHVPYLVAAPLPSDLYADSSHPLADGYALLAQQLASSSAFQSTILNGGK
jgi:hypothetical protein